MIEERKNKAVIRRKIILIAITLSLVSIFLSAVLFRLYNPNMQQFLNHQNHGVQEKTGAMPSSGMDMDAVRQMLEALEARIAKNPQDVEALLQVANIYLMRRDLDSALGYLHKAKHVAGNNLMFLMQLAQNFFELEQFEDARECLERILQQEPENMIAHYNLGIVLKYHLAQSQKAKEQFRFIVQAEHATEQLRAEAQKELE